MGSEERFSGGKSLARNPTHKRKAKRPTAQRERLGVYGVSLFDLFIVQLESQINKLESLIKA